MITYSLQILDILKSGISTLNKALLPSHKQNINLYSGVNVIGFLEPLTTESDMTFLHSLLDIYTYKGIIVSFA